MNWEALGAIGEIVGAIGVIATLTYLAIQIRQNTRMSASELRQGFYDYTTRQMLHGTDSAQLSALLAKAGMTNESLSPGERQYGQDALPEDDWNTCRALLRSFWLFAGKEHLAVWEQFRPGGWLDEDFVTECEKLRKEAAHFAAALDSKDLNF